MESVRECLSCGGRYRLSSLLKEDESSWCDTGAFYQKQRMRCMNWLSFWGIALCVLYAVISRATTK